ncbi:MAG TPA: D-alanyl-D-alanine carboxypeptidase, partial [Vampirovibrionales bacterium]
MLRTPRLTAAVLVTLCVLMTACNPSEAPETEVSSAEASNPEIQTPEPPPMTAIAPLDNPDPTVTAAIAQYINSLSSQGFPPENQGIWMQRGDTLLAQHQGTIPLPAASLTKIATSLVALQTFGPDHEFITEISATGPIKNGELQGDLVIQGEGDPLFVWEEAMAIGNRLNEMGIQRVTGDLVILDKFYMNFETDPALAGNFLLEGINGQIWPSEAETQYQTLPPGTPRPQVAIAGTVRVATTPPAELQPLIRHYSLPVVELLKRMNQYSNNPMAEMFADAVGGPQVVA